MGHIFYFFGLLIVLLNLITFSKFKKIFELREWMVKFKQITGRNPVANDYRKPDDKDVLAYWSVSIVLTSIWIFFGLLTKSWYVYLMLLIFNTLINLSIKSIGEFNRFSFALSFIKSLVVIFTLGFLTINHFHLHWDIWLIIKSL